MSLDLELDVQLDDAEPTLRDWIDAQPTREAWLTERLYLDVMPRLKALDIALPTNIRVGCGWAGTGHDACTLGICYDSSTSKDGSIEIFVSPALDKEHEVMGALWHEVAHAIAGVKEQHNNLTYGVLCQKIGLTSSGVDGQGSWPTQAWPGDDLAKYIVDCLASAEPYPHASLTPLPPAPPKVVEVAPKQSTRMLKAVCGGCGYTIRLAFKWTMRGMPHCKACNQDFALAGAKPDDGEDN